MPTGPDGLGGLVLAGEQARTVIRVRKHMETGEANLSDLHGGLRPGLQGHCFLLSKLYLRCIARQVNLTAFLVGAATSCVVETVAILLQRSRMTGANVYCPEWLTLSV